METMSADFLAANIAAHWIQSGLLAAVVLGALRLAGAVDPRFRLAALQLALLVILLLPLQPWRVQELRSDSSTEAAVVSSEVLSAASAGDAPLRLTNVDPASALVLLIVGGIAVRTLWLFYGVFRLTRFSRTAAAIPAPQVSAGLEARLRVSPRYIQQVDMRGPWTFGFFRSTVALPAGFDSLASDSQRAIICHELLHVKRRDIAVAFVEELAAAALWFQPWTWVLRAQIRIAREQIVDAAVVNLLGGRDEYVRCLVDISGHDLSPHFSQAGAGMLRARELRARVDALFQEVRMSRARMAATAVALVAAVTATTWTAVAAVPFRGGSAIVDRPSSIVDRPASIGERLPAEARSARGAPQNVSPGDSFRRQTKMGFAEYPVDALEKGIHGVVTVAITINPSGQVTTASVITGPPELRTSAFRAAMGLQFEPGPSMTSMTVPVEYLLTANSWGVRVGALGKPVWTVAKVMNSPSTSPAAGTDPARALRVGGNIPPPRKIADVPPMYPEEAQKAKVQGVVLLEVVVDEGGNVSETRKLRSIPLLDQAAIDAVKQWKYTPTLLNGVPVPVLMAVTVNFTLRDGGPGSAVRLSVTVPDEFQRTPDPIRMTVRADDVGVVVAKNNETFGFVPLAVEDSAAQGRARIGIYRMNPEGSPVPLLLGSVEVEAGGGAVQSVTTPSFGIELLSVEKR